MPGNEHAGLPFSITIKLLLLILPLVCVPIAIVGYLSYQTSVKSVTRLSRDEQMLQARVAAAEINSIFQSSHMDLETISRLVVEKYEESPIAGTPSAARQTQITKLFQDFLARSPYYHQIRLTDREGNVVLGARPGNAGQELHRENVQLFDWDKLAVQHEQVQLSKITKNTAHQLFVLHFARPLLLRDNSASGAVIVDLDFSKVIELVNSIRPGKDGYAFMVDKGGRIISHPLFKPYDYDLTKYTDSRLREFVIDMISGGTGWKTFYQNGERAAAYAPVPATGWSLAVSVPISEFVNEAENLRAYVIQIVVATLILSGFAVTYLSYKMLTPVRRLVTATERVADGDLGQEIPVRSADELGTLTRSFNHMVKRLKEIQTELVASERLISMGKLSAGVAHEIRNPLNAMKGAIVYLQRRRREDPLLMEYTGIILEEIGRLNGFVTEFLYFARQSPPRRAPASFNGLIQNILNLFEEEFRKKRIRIKTLLEEGLPVFRIDPQQLEQVFVNLFVNAIHAMPGGGRLTISTASKPEEDRPGGPATVVVSIADNGAGISPEHLDTIFEPFFSTKESGTGLGLPISRGIVEAHGGTLAIASEPGRGTTVSLEFQLHDYEPLDTGNNEENRIET